MVRDPLLRCDVRVLLVHMQLESRARFESKERWYGARPGQGPQAVFSVAGCILGDSAVAAEA